MSTFRTWTAVALLVGSGFLCNLITVRAQSSGVTPLGRNLPGLDLDKLEGGVTSCESVWATEPVLIYDRSGGTLLGSVHEGLILYSNGLAIRTRKDATDVRDRGRVEIKNLSPVSTKALWEQLMAAGAAVVCDDPVYVSDMPLTKVTLFTVPDTDAVAHTFCFYQAPAGAANVIDLIVKDFIATQFEGF